MLWSVYPIISPISQRNFFLSQANVFRQSFMKTPSTFLCSFSYFIFWWLYHIHPSLITIYFIMVFFPLRSQISLHITLIPHSPWDTHLLNDFPCQFPTLQLDQAEQCIFHFLKFQYEVKSLLNVMCPITVIFTVLKMMINHCWL